MMKAHVLLVAACFCLSSPAAASSKVDVHGLILGDEGARYVKGVPTLDLQQSRGAIQLRSLGFKDNRPVFAVAFFNASAEPVNIGLENIHAEAAGSGLAVFSVQELERQAKRKAWWTQFGMAMLGATSSAMAAAQTNTYRSTFRTPYGSYSYRSTYPSLAGQLQANAIRHDTVFGMAMVQQRLDEALDSIGNHVVQRTTVDPGSSYAGLIVLDKLKNGKPPLELKLAVDWNGERYNFGYLVQKAGQSVPAVYQSKLAANAKPKVMTNRIVNVGSTTPGAPVAGAVQMPVAAAAAASPQGAIALRSGAVKIPAKTASGYCIVTPAGYTSTGTRDYPVVNASLPRCSDAQVAAGQ